MAVFFDEVKKYRRPLIRASILRAFRELKVDLDHKRSAFIKVNIVRPAKPRSAVITHPAVVEALVEVLRDSGIDRITVGEGPAVGVDVEEAFRKSGYVDLARRIRIELLNLHEAKRIGRKWDYGTLELPQALLESDVYINVAKMKTHFHTCVTLGIKNQQGLLLPQDKKYNHTRYELHRPLISIAKVVRPDITIIDGVESMEGEGPTKGKKRHTCVMAYGDDIFETDIACCRFMGVDPYRVEHLRYALEDGLVSPEPPVIGRAFDEHRTSFVLPSPGPKKIFRFYSWKNYRACAADEHAFEEAIHLALTTPRYWFKFFPKFAFLVLFRRLDLIRGRDAAIPSDAGRILCIGDCSWSVAERVGACHVPGCPPKPRDIIEAIIRM